MAKITDILEDQEGYDLRGGLKLRTSLGSQMKKRRKLWRQLIGSDTCKIIKVTIEDMMCLVLAELMSPILPL